MYALHPFSRAGAGCIVAVAVIVIAFCAIDIAEEAMGDTSTIYNLTAKPIPEGRGLNISWSMNGTSAALFQVLYVHDTEINLSLTIVGAETPWYVHVGLVPGMPYSYSIVPMDDERNPMGPSSEVVTGWPIPPPSNVSPLDPPSYDELPPITNSRSLIVSGFSKIPGVGVEVERIRPDPWSNMSCTQISSASTGMFSLVIDLEEGVNIIHARVNDPFLGQGSWTRTSYVLLDLQPPVVVVKGADRPYEVGMPVELDANGSHDDNGILSYAWGIHDVVNLTYPGPRLFFAPQKSGPINITLVVTDFAGNAVTSNISLAVEEEDIPPRFEKLPRKIVMVGGQAASFDVSEWVEDEDDNKHELEFYVSGEDTRLYTTGIVGSKLTLVTIEDQTGQDYLSIRVSDPSGKTDEATVLIHVEANPQESDNTLLIVILVSTGLIISIILVVKRSRHPGSYPVTQESELHAYYVKSTYLIHMDGRLVMDMHSVDEGFKDADMISGMFTAIQDFVRDSFNTSASLENISFGEDHLTITRGKNIYLATVSYGQVDQEYLMTSKAIIRRLEAELTGVIEDWDGNSKIITYIERFIRPLHSNNRDRTLEQLKRECAPIEFCATPSIEFKQGFVKYVVELDNHTNEIVVDPCLDIQWDKDVLHLVKTNPPEARTEGRFRLDNIHPGESRIMELFFDPQTCLESFIRGSVTFMDIQGELHNLPLENTLADVNCPIFFTADNANTAMLNKLMKEDLECVDSKTYRYAMVLDSKAVYKLATAAATSYDIQFVMDFTDEDPFYAEAWFYGETKIKGCKVLIRVTVKEETSTVEFLVASSIQMVIPGLLAELGHLFIAKMDEKYTHGYNVNRIVKRFYQEDIQDNPIGQKDPIVKELFNNAMRRSTNYREDGSGGSAESE
jgi:hypothetical protein